MKATILQQRISIATVVALYLITVLIFTII